MMRKSYETLKQEQEEARQRERRWDRVAVRYFESAKKPTCVIVISAALLWAWAKHQDHYRRAYREEAVLRHLRDRAKHDTHVAKLIEEAELKVEDDSEAYEAYHHSHE